MKKKKDNEFMIFTCGHDDPSWCGKECTKVISETEWLDIIWKGRMVKINGKGQIRNKPTKANQKPVT